MSVEVPRYEFKLASEDGGNIYPYGFAQTSGELDDAVRELGDILPDLLRLAEVEKAIEEIKANMTDDERAEVEAQETAENTEPEAAPAEDEAIEEEPIQLRGETKTCPVCKAEVDGDALFCNHCGAQL